MICRQVHPALIEDIWPRVSNWIADAITKGDRWWTLDRLRGELYANDNAALFVVLDHDGIYGAAVVMIEDKPSGGRMAHFPALGGENFGAWRQFLPDLEDWARSRGANEMTVTGRVGWQRVLKRDGYKKQSVTLEKSL